MNKFRQAVKQPARSRPPGFYKCVKARYKFVTALQVIATFFYVRGLRPNDRRSWSILAGSGMAALAFLVRQHGALIPFAVVIYLLATRRLRPNRPNVLSTIQRFESTTKPFAASERLTISGLCLRVLPLVVWRGLGRAQIFGTFERLVVGERLDVIPVAVGIGRFHVQEDLEEPRRHLIFQPSAVRP